MTLPEIRRILKQAQTGGVLTMTASMLPINNLNHFLLTMLDEEIVLTGAKFNMLTQNTPPELMVTGDLDTSWSLPGIDGQTIKDIKLTLHFLERPSSNEIDFQLDVEGKLAVNSEEFPLEGALVEENSIFLSVPDAAKGIVDLAALIDFGLGSSMKTRIPTGVTAFSQANLTRLNVGLRFGNESFTSFDIAVGSNASWEVLTTPATSVQIEETAVGMSHFSVAPDSFSHLFHGGIRGQIHMERDYQCRIDIQSDDNWGLELMAEDGVPLLTLDELSQWLGGSALSQSIQDELGVMGLGEIALDGINMRINPITRSLITVALSGSMEIATHPFELTAFLPDFEFSGKLAPESPLNLKTFLPQFIPDLFDAPDLTITDLYLTAQPSQARYFASTRIIDVWTLPISHTTLSITEMEMQIQKDPTGALGSIAGVFDLGDYRFFVEADHPTVDKGWQFAGTTPDEQAISLSTFVLSLTNLFGISLSTGIPDITLSSLGISFNTHSKSFTFKGETAVPSKIPLGQNVHDVHTMVDIQSEIDPRTGKRTFSGLIEGDLKIGDATFKLSYEMGQENHVFKAVWTGESGVTISLNDLAQALGVPIPQDLDVPDGLDMNSAQFTYFVERHSFILTAESANHGEVFFVADRPAETEEWRFIFGVAFTGIAKLSSLNQINGHAHLKRDFSAADFLEFKEVSLLFSTATYEAFTLPRIVQNDVNPNDEGDSANLLQRLDGVQLDVEPGVSFAAVIDFRQSSSDSDNQLLVKNLNTIVNQDELILQMVISQNEFKLAASLAGSVGIPTNDGADLQLRNPQVLMEFIVDEESSAELGATQHQFALSLLGSLEMQIDHHTVKATGSLRIHENAADVSLKVVDESGKGLPGPPGLRGVHFDNFGLEMGVVFEPPGVDLGLEGNFHIGNDPAQDRFAFVMELVEAVPNPLLLAFHLEEISLPKTVTAVTGEDPPTINLPAFLNDLKATDVSFHWADSIVVLPDGTSANPGFGFNGSLKVFGFRAHAMLEVNRQSGISGEAILAPIHLGHFLAISGNSPGFFVKEISVEGEWRRLQNSQILAATPIISGQKVDGESVENERKVAIVPPGGPIFRINSTREPFLQASCKVTLFDLFEEEIEALVDQNGLNFMLYYALSDIAHLELDCTLKTEDHFSFSAHSNFEVDIKGDIGPLNPELAVTTLHLDTIISATMEITLDANKFEMAIKDGRFEFEGVQLSLPTPLVLDVPLASLTHLAAAILAHIEAEAKTIFADLIAEAGHFINAVDEEIEQIGAELEGDIVAIEDEAVKTAEAVAQAAETAVHAVEETADAIINEATQIEDEVIQIGSNVVTEVDRIEKEADAEVERIGREIKKVGNEAVHEAEKIGKAIIDEEKALEQQAKAIIDAVEQEVEKIATAVAHEVVEILDEARAVAKQLLDEAAQVVQAIEAEAEKIWKEIEDLAAAVARTIVHGVEAVGNFLTQLF